MHGDVVDTSLVFTPYTTHHQFSHFFLQTIICMKPHSSTWHDPNLCHHLSPKMSTGSNPSPYFQLLLTSDAYIILCAPPLKLLQHFSLITNLSCSTHGLSLLDLSESIFTPLSTLILIIQSQPTCYIFFPWRILSYSLSPSILNSNATFSHRSSLTPLTCQFSTS